MSISRDGFLQLHQPHTEAMRAELSAALLAPQPQLPPKYLYDELGSRLFAAICALPEYYPTRTEAAILRAHLGEIARSTGRGVTLIDLGAGTCEKAAALFPALQPAQYVPVDISVEFLKDAVAGLRCRFPQIGMLGIGMDFSTELALPSLVREERRLFFYPGSSIGNFPPDAAAAFLGRVRDACDRKGGLLIGIDLVKDRQVLEAAYDDAVGLTAAFNRNLLQHLNALLGTDFDPRQWRHRAICNAAQSRVEMHLDAQQDITVRWPQGERHFRRGDALHTESSYKYTPENFRQLLERAGFAHVRSWTDERGWFLVCHATVA